jgi:hypothetical protein
MAGLLMINELEMMRNEAIVLFGYRDRKITKDNEVVLAALQDEILTQGFPSTKQES